MLESGFYTKGQKRLRTSTKAKEDFNVTSPLCWREELEKKKKKVASNSLNPRDPFAVTDLLNGLDCGKYGSVTKDIEDLISRRTQLLKTCCEMYPNLKSACLDVENSFNRMPSKGNRLDSPSEHDVIDLEDDVQPIDVTERGHVSLKGAVVILDSDEDENAAQRPTYPLQAASYQFQDVFLKRPASHLLTQDSVVRNLAQIQSLSQGDTATPEVKTAVQKDKGLYVGIEDDMDIEDSNQQSDANYDGLADIWKEMSFALESSKDIPVNPSDEPSSDSGEECDHSFILKDDLGYVCRICGVVQRRIETIIEFQYVKGSGSTRTYKYEGRTVKDKDLSEILPDEIRNDFLVSEMSAHPRHSKQMKPHQIEGFNFLLSNLVADNPGGCIMAHAPGSGKTFMIISFMQSFMAKYPHARPLVVLPRGILATWKKEFLRWQVEDIPLYDFYSVKADNRSQHLEVLKQWVEERSILFLGYKQFSSIVCDDDTSKTATSCQEILLTCPSILVLDEGHTPRNENTDVLNSLKKVQTPRKVVLSGTLYQNHVKEVFNILDLVRPKFLNLENSRAIRRRIESKLVISGMRKNFKRNKSVFYDLVEAALQKHKDFKRKVSVIQDLREMTSKVLHYYRGDFLDELPGLVDFTVLLNLTPPQKREVRELKKLVRKFKINSQGSAIYVHPELKYLSRNCASKDRVDETRINELLETLDLSHGVKTKFFLNLLRLCELGHEKLLVFSQYLLPLKFLERLTVKVRGWSLGREFFVITGDSDSDVRELSMEQFNNSPDARVFFGSIKACGEGISLVGASRVMILDVHLNPSVTRQALGRAFRPGQVRKVYAYRLVSAGSPEEDDHVSCSRKESISKMWFEWNEYCGHQDFEMESVDVSTCGDDFLEDTRLSEDVISLYKR